MIQVVIADDHPVMRHGIKRILEEEADMQVVGEAANGQELLQKIEQSPCDCVLLDIGMPGGTVSTHFLIFGATIPSCRC